MNPILKDHLLQAAQVFSAGFLTTLGTTLSLGHIQWTSAFWAGLLIAAVTAGVKELFAKYAPLSFGGRVGKTVLGSRKY